MKYFIILLFVCSSLSAATINVPANYGTIQGAINAASSGDTIFVATGTYVENLDTIGKDLFIQAARGASPVLDGGWSYSCLEVSGGETVLLQGFSVTNGDTQQNPNSRQSGAGVYIENSNVTLKYCIFYGNLTSYAGIEIEGLDVYANFSTTGYELKIHDSEFKDYNITSTSEVYALVHAEDSGILIDSSFEFIGNTVHSNSIYCGTAVKSGFIDDLLVKNCMFASNTIGGSGPLYIYGAQDGDYVLVNNIFFDNMVNKIEVLVGIDLGTGGGFNFMGMGNSTLTVTNNTFCSNHAPINGGAAHLLTLSSSTIRLHNNIFWDNTYMDGVILTDNNIFMRGVFAVIRVYVRSSTLMSGLDSIKTEGYYSLTTSSILTDNPLFMNIGSGNLHLTANSPCIDVGNLNAPHLPAFDFEGNARCRDGNGDFICAPDHGALEF